MKCIVITGALILVGVLIIVEGITALIDYRATTIWKLLFLEKYKYKESRNKDLGYYSWSLSSFKKVKEFPTIKFNQFKDFYYLNSDSWRLYEYFVQKDNNQDMIMTFEWKEWKLYNKFYKQLEKEKEVARKNRENQKRTEKQNIITRAILESVQKDIDNIRNEQQKNINEAARLVKGITIYD